MQVQLLWVLLLFSAQSAICSEADPQRGAGGEKLLGKLFTSKLGRQSSPYGVRVNICSLMGRWSHEGRLLDEDSPEMLSPEQLDQLYALQSLCRILRPLAVSLSVPEYPEEEQVRSSEREKRRKYPYILKRQLARRPYILK